MNVSFTLRLAVADESVTNQISSLSDDFSELLANIMYISACDRVYDKRLRKALDYIITHYQQTIIQSDLARHVGLSSSYLCILLKEQSNMTFTEIVNKVRVANSVVLICKTNDTLEQIAFGSGFDTGRTFTREFRQCTGFTPKDFRSIYRNLLQSGNALPDISTPERGKEKALFRQERRGGYSNADNEQGHYRSLAIAY